MDVNGHFLPLTSQRLGKSFPTLHETRRFITVFTRTLHWSLSWVRWIQSISSHAIYLRSILILSSHLRKGLPHDLFPSGFQNKSPYAFIFLSCALYVLSLLSYFDSIILIISGEEMKLGISIIQSSPASYYLLSFGFKYSPQHSVLKYPQSMVKVKLSLYFFLIYV
jgi:hypothetical protein